jgi:hybrid cluster-associated redox disulfide protein
MNSPISSDITIKELLDFYPQLLQPFMDLGLLCVGCPTEAFHNIADVAREYHLDLDQLRLRLERAIEQGTLTSNLKD